MTFALKFGAAAVFFVSDPQLLSCSTTPHCHCCTSHLPTRTAIATMSNKRAYSTYSFSDPAGPLVTANGFDAPPPQVSRRDHGSCLFDSSSQQTQAQQQPAYSSPHIHIPGAWPSEHDATAIQEAAPAHSSFFTTVNRWATTVSLSNILSLPQRLAQRFLRRQTICAVSIIGSDGSNKKRFIAAGVADEIATPSPSVRARANQARRQNVTRNTYTTQRDIWSPGPVQSRQSPPNFYIASPVTYHTPPPSTPTSLYAPDDQDEDISMEFEFDNMLFSTPPRNRQTGSPRHIPFNSPHDQSPYGQTQPRHLQAESPGKTQQIDSPSYLPWNSLHFLSHVGQTSPAPASPCPKGYAGSASTLDRPSRNISHYSSLTPMRRQLVKLQFGVEVKRLQTPQEAEAQTDAPEEGFPETGAASSSPTKNNEEELSYLPDASSSPFQTEVDSSSPFQTNVNSPSLYRLPEEEVETAPFEYENDLSFLLDAPTPPRPRGVRWTKHSDVRRFFYDAKVAEMLDETLESITSDHDTSISFWQGRGRRNREEVDSDDEESSPSRSSAGSPIDGDHDNVDDSLEESMISDELAENLHDAFMNKMALEALKAPLPPPPKPLVASLSEEEQEVLKSAAAETANGRMPNKWVIEEKLSQSLAQRQHCQ
jgi:hypothetical protein